MACPYFLPQRPLDSGGWNPAPRLPLIDAWAGECHAPQAKNLEPGENETREFCNLGYARGRCPHFPPDAAADAVRFSISVNEAGDRRVIYVLEKDHAPVEHGLLGETAVDPLLSRQGQAFLDSYCRKEQAASAAI